MNKRYSSARTKVQRCKQPTLQRPATPEAIPMLAEGKILHCEFCL